MRRQFLLTPFLSLLFLSSLQATPLQDVALRTANDVTSASWWYVDQSPTEVNNTAFASNARLVAVTAYNVGGAIKFAVVMISNTGADANSWWWYVDQTVSSLFQHSIDNNAQLTHISAYDVGGTTYYAGIMIPNTGEDAKSWWWYIGVSPAQIQQFVSDNHARLIGIDAEPGGASTTFAVIMISDTGADAADWWWYFGQSPADISNSLLRHHALVDSITAYDGGGGNVYAVIMTANLQRSSAQFWRRYE